MNTTPPVNGVQQGPGEATASSDDENAMTHSTSAYETSADDDHLTPSATTSSDPTNSASNELLDRRGAGPAAASFPPEQESSTPVMTTSGRIDYLRPITPTGPFMALDINEDSTSTPTAEQLVEHGPMTPTNTAGPFVFDGSAGGGAIGTAVSTGGSTAEA